MTIVSDAGHTSHKHDVLFWLAVGLAALCSLAFQGSRGLYESTEGRYAECVRQTLQNGSLLEPMLNGEHHWTKPPLTYVAIAGGLLVLGENTWGARAYLAVSFIFTVLTVYYLGLLLWGRKAAGLPALIYATSPFTVGAANSISTDTLLALWLALSMLFFWCAVRRNQRRYMVMMWVAVGLAVLTKGPMGFLSLLSIFPSYVMLRMRKEHVPGFFNIAGLGLFIVLGLGWYLWSVAKYPELFRYWVMHETIGRMIEGEFNRNAQFHKIFTLYVPVLLFGTGLWIIPPIIKLRRIPWPWGRWWRWLSWDHEIEWTFLLLSLILPFILLAACQSRLPLYILPLFVPLSLILGKGLGHLVETGTLGIRAVLVIACISASICGGAKGISAEIPSSRDMKQLAKSIAPIIERQREAKLILLQKDPLNGLQFYLKQVIPYVRLDELPTQDEIEEWTRDGALLLFRAKYLPYCEGYVNKGLLRLEFRNNFWVLAAGEIREIWGQTTN